MPHEHCSTAGRDISEIHEDQSRQYDIILQPETRPISQEQPAAEVNGIYAGPVMVGTKCIEVDNQSTLGQWGSVDDNSALKARGQDFEGIVDRPVDRPLSADDFGYIGTQFPMPRYSNANFTAYTEPRVSYEIPADNSQVVASATPSSYNAPPAGTL